jgi:hypothetical protein
MYATQIACAREPGQGGAGNCVAHGVSWPWGLMDDLWDVGVRSGGARGRRRAGGVTHASSCHF